MKILVIDVGGTHIKVRVSGQAEVRKIASGMSMTPSRLVKQVKALTADWSYGAVSVGFPALIARGRIVTRPVNLARGWVGFDLAKALGRPTKLINDAAMQALGSYKGGRLLFLGLGTGLGSAMIVDGHVAPMELAHLPYRKGRTYEEYVGAAALKRLGTRRWRKHVRIIIEMFRVALEPDDLVVGGGNARLLARLPKGVRAGRNANAFIGGFRLWEGAASTDARRGRRRRQAET